MTMPGADDEYRGRTVLVIGYGRTGVAVTRYLLTTGARVRITDQRPAVELGELPADPHVELRCGAETVADLDGVTLVVPSPGVPVSAPLLREAVRRGIPVRAEIEVAARALAMPIVAVTGTNGKSTTTTLLGDMLRAGGERPFVGGNLGTPLVSAIGGRYSMAVAEVSSFQLEWVDRLRPRVAILLNVTEDHLDRYAGLDAYGETKLRLFARQTAEDVAILNGSDAWIRRHAHGLRAAISWFGGGDLAVLRADAAAIRMRLDGREEIYPLAKVHLAGAHNRENMMAAIAAARAVGVAPAAVQEALEAFRGLPHRLELVRERDGVRWIDDSKGTNAGAVVMSLAGYAHNVILLAGGIDKGGDYGVLVEPVRRGVTHAILFGASREMLAHTLTGATDVQLVDGLAEAVRRAAALAMPGDTVMLSPACASFDMFRDYADRGRQFQALVHAL
jgi:UDP-N-acetylmuramoylalanine--D-glutamate ligase